MTLSLKQTLPLLLIFSLLTAIAKAEENKPLPIEVTADRLESQTQNGVSTYQGNVEITQGKTQLKGDRVTLKHPNGKIQHAIVLGEPATFQRFLQAENKWIKGQANQITYNLDDENLELLGNAKVQQGQDNAITGPKITYHLKDKTLTAEKTAQQTERVKVIFQPETP